MTQLEKQQFLEDYKKSLEGKTVEELKALEEGLMNEWTEVEKEINETVYDLPKDNYANVQKAVRFFLDKQTVNWEYTQSMLELCDYWGVNFPEKISFKTLHTTLGMICGLQFTGSKEWSKVVMINTYLQPLREAYQTLADKPGFIKDRHALIMGAMGLLETIDKPVVTNTETSIQEVK